jgi:hypothetical protein
MNFVIMGNKYSQMAESGGAVGSDIAQGLGFDSLMASLAFFFDKILPAALWSRRLLIL